MSSKLKKDCTPEEWGVLLKSRREYVAAWRKTPRGATLNKAAKQRHDRLYAEKRKTPEEKAKAKAWRGTAKAKEKKRQNRIAAKENAGACIAATERNWKKLGIDINHEAFSLLHLLQKGTCAICGELLTKPRVDHNHTTGEVRGLLCNACNLIEGAITKKGFTGAKWGSLMDAYLAHPPARCGQ